MFHTLNIFFGISGNLLTLLSIPYARKRRRFGFQASSCITYTEKEALSDQRESHKRKLTLCTVK